MNFLIDTCVISELVKLNPNAEVVDWLKQTPSKSLFLCVITIGEIQKGLTKLPRSKRKEKLVAWLNTLLEAYNDRIFPINLKVAENWGVIQGNSEKIGKPMASLDSLIAAVAYTHSLTLVTRNERDFEPANLLIFNPWGISG